MDAPGGVAHDAFEHKTPGEALRLSDGGDSGLEAHRKTLHGAPACQVIASSGAHTIWPLLE